MKGTAVFKVQHSILYPGQKKIPSQSYKNHIVNNCIRYRMSHKSMLPYSQVKPAAISYLEAPLLNPSFELPDKREAHPQV